MSGASRIPDMHRRAAGMVLAGCLLLGYAACLALVTSSAGIPGLTGWVAITAASGGGHRHPGRGAEPSSSQAGHLPHQRRAVADHRRGDPLPPSVRPSMLTRLTAGRQALTALHRAVGRRPIEP